MRRIIGWICLLLGAFLVATSVMLIAVAPKKAERVPLNTVSWTYLSGEATHLNKDGKAVQDPVVVASLTKIDPKASNDKYAAWITTTCVNVDKDDPPKCLPKTDDRLVNNSESVVATDRTTAMATDKLDLGSKADKPTPSGLVNKFPFNTKKKDYAWWDGVLGKTVTAKYSGTKKFDGLETYKFVISVPTTAAEISDGVQGTYAFDNTQYIEPKTGSPIDQNQKQVRKLKDGSTALDMDIAYTKDQVASNVKDGKANVAKLGMFTGPIPWVVGIAGLLVIALGAFLVFAGGKKRAKA